MPRLTRVSPCRREVTPGAEVPLNSRVLCASLSSMTREGQHSLCSPNTVAVGPLHCKQQEWKQRWRQLLHQRASGFPSELQLFSLQCTLRVGEAGQITFSVCAQWHWFPHSLQVQPLLSPLAVQYLPSTLSEVSQSGAKSRNSFFPPYSPCITPLLSFSKQQTSISHSSVSCHSQVPTAIWHLLIIYGPADSTLLTQGQ